MISIFVLQYYADEQDRAEESKGGVLYSRGWFWYLIAWGPVILQWKKQLQWFHFNWFIWGIKYPHTTRYVNTVTVKNNTRFV
jgi:hypothetical protein